MARVSGPHCLDCYAEKWTTVIVGDANEKIKEMSEARFSKFCKKTWEMRLVVALKYERMNKRTTSWMRAAEDIDDDPEMQGASCKERSTYLKGLAKHHLELVRRS